MGCDVYANSDEIACKAGDGKVIAAFPDVCLSPPTPPAGPVPVPYPNTSFSKDMKNGSRTVTIKGKEVMLKDQSFYNSSPLADEAATKTLGAGVITHVITGKTYFVSWSMDVKFEGENVDRHSDITTSNHASPMANASLPWSNISTATMALAQSGTCPCCKQPLHSPGKPTDGKSWYDHRAEVEGPAKARKATKIREAKEARTVQEKKNEVAAQIKAAEDRVKDGEKCSCPPGTKLLPEDPCNVFYMLPPEPNPVTKANQQDRAKHQKAMTDAMRAAFNPEGGGGIKDKVNQKRVSAGKAPCREFMHLTPIAAGGCPGNEDGTNLECKDDLCKPCRDIDTDWNKKGFQTINFPETSVKL